MILDGSSRGALLLGEGWSCTLKHWFSQKKPEDPELAKTRDRRKRRKSGGAAQLKK